MQIEGGAGADPPDGEGLSAMTADMLDEGTGSMSAIDVSDALARLGAEYDVEVGRRRDAVHADDACPIRGPRRIVTRRYRDGPEPQGCRLRPGPAAACRPAPAVEGHGTGDGRARVPAAAVRRRIPTVISPSATTIALRAMRCGTSSVSRRGLSTLDGRRSLSRGRWRSGELERIRECRIWRLEGSGAEAAHRRRGCGHRAHRRAPARLAIVPRDGAAQSELRIGHLSARRDTPDYPALLVMNAVLGGQFVSRVNLKLREEKGYTYGARTGFDWRRGLGAVSLQASVHTARDGGRCP